MHEIEAGAQRADHVAGLSDEERELLGGYAKASELDKQVLLRIARTVAEQAQKEAQAA